MKVDLRYFSGTGNSYKVLDTCKDAFLQYGCNASIFSITDDVAINDNVDLIGFCCPVYAFGIPRIFRNYLSNLPSFRRPVKAFILITAGAAKESGFAIKQATELMMEKGLDVVYSDVVQMPNNWIVSMELPPKEEALAIINAGVGKAQEIAERIIDGVVRHHTFNYPPTYSRLGFYKDYYLFKWLGVTYLWQDFRTDETCDGCELCEKLCSTQSIQMVAGKPQWSKTCEQCMRCANYCPKQAIFQKGEGSIKGKNSYFEPTFKPLL